MCRYKRSGCGCGCGCGWIDATGAFSLEGEGPSSSRSAGGVGRNAATASECAAARMPSGGRASVAGSSHLPIPTSAACDSLFCPLPVGSSCDCRSEAAGEAMELDAASVPVAVPDVPPLVQSPPETPSRSSAATVKWKRPPTALTLRSSSAGSLLPTMAASCRSSVAVTAGGGSSSTSARFSPKPPSASLPNADSAKGSASRMMAAASSRDIRSRRAPSGPALMARPPALPPALSTSLPTPLGTAPAPAPAAAMDHRMRETADGPCELPLPCAAA